MLFTQSGARPGDRVLVQGAGGGVATAAIALARAAGMVVWATSRDEAKRTRALELGAHEVFEPGARLPSRVDAVLETVGKATWSHSMKSLRPGGTLVVSGATTGSDPSADLSRLFFLQLRVIGSTMGTRSELEALLRMCEATGLRPLVDQELALSDADQAFGRLASGDVVGKLVLAP
jgi:NADPH:quinone reductase-like Zn-dependent oxidoreductase